MFKANVVGGGRGLGALLQYCLRRGHTGRQVPVIANSNPGGYIKRTSPGGIKFILTSVSEERWVGNGRIWLDFISMN
jgi:hypothetical protein